MGAILESGLERIGHTLEEVTEDDVIEPLPPNIVVLAAKLQDDTYVVKGVRVAPSRVESDGGELNSQCPR